MTEQKLITPRKLSGFMELMPNKQIIFDNMVSKIKEVYAKHAFMPLDTPVLELSEILQIRRDKLKELQEQVSRKKHLTVKRDELQKQYDRLKEKAAQLEAEKVSEQADVERLEARSLANFFYQVVGKMDEKLSKEKEEAYAAAVKYDAAVSEM